MREDACVPAERSRQRRTERAFVIQFDPVEGARSRLRGRVECVASGEAIHFRSLKQLVDFMVKILRSVVAVGLTPGSVLTLEDRSKSEKLLQVEQLTIEVDEGD